MSSNKNLLLLVCACLLAYVDAYSTPTPTTAGSGYIAQPGDTVLECGSALNNIFFNDALDSGYGRTFVIYSNTSQSSSYQNNVHCEARFFTDNSPVIFTVSLQKFQLETQDSCVWDSFCMNGILLCGTRNQTQQYNFLAPAYNSFTLRFISDSIIALQGFTVLVYTYSASYYAEIYEPTGVFYAPYQDSITQYQYESLNTLGNYSDSCNTDTLYDTTTATYDNYQSSSTYDYYYETSTPYQYYYTTSYYDGMAQNCRYVIQNAASYINSAIQTLTYGMSLLLNSLNS